MVVSTLVDVAPIFVNRLHDKRCVVAGQRRDRPGTNHTAGLLVDDQATVRKRKRRVSVGAVAALVYRYELLSVERNLNLGRPDVAYAGHEQRQHIRAASRGRGHAGGYLSLANLRWSGHAEPHFRLPRGHQTRCGDGEHIVWISLIVGEMTNGEIIRYERARLSHPVHAVESEKQRVFATVRFLTAPTECDDAKSPQRRGQQRNISSER